MNRRSEPNLARRRWVRYVAMRLAQGAFVLWAAFTLAFIVLYLLPSDPIRIMLSGSGAEFANADDAQIAALRAEFGFDRPPHVQYFAMLGEALTGNFGRSIQRGLPVTELISQALGKTLVLGAVALGLALILGFAVALLATSVRNRVVRQIVLSTPAFAVSVPTFWSALLLTQLFAFQLGWINIFDQSSWKAIILPALTLAIPTSAFIAQILAKSLATTIREPYINVVRSRGVREVRVLTHSALRNASLPLLTMLGIIVGNMLAGSVVVETVFARMGVGRVTFEAVNAQDIPVVMGVVVFASVVFVLISLVVDLLYPLLDPRVTIRKGGEGAPKPNEPVPAASGKNPVLEGAAA